MTREEAIEILKAHHMWTGEQQEIIDVRKENKALEMAIQALSQEPCDDAISREAVNTLVDELARAISDERCFIPQRGRSTATIMQDILDLPPVTQKSGKWIRTPLLTCDRCNKINKSGEETDYCPNCGAKMVEPQESEVRNEQQRHHTNGHTTA